MTIYDIPGFVNWYLHLAASSGNIKASFQVSGIYPFNRDNFHDEEFMGAYVTDGSTPSVAAAASNSNINLLKPTGYVMHQQFNIQQLYVLPTLYLCVLYLSENKQRLVPLTA